MKEFMTFKSGKFIFCDQYDHNKIEKLLVEASVLANFIEDLPLLPGWSSQIDPELLYSSIASTAAIEGNSLSAQEVKAIDEGKMPDKRHTAKDRLEIENLINTYRMLDRQQSINNQSKFFITEEHISELHKNITFGLPYDNNIPGTYRNGIVMVGDKAHGGIYTPPKIIDDIRNLMKQFVGWINNEDMLQTHPFIRSALAHYHFALIHPFWDGNGRVARLIEALILQASGIRFIPKMLSNYYYRNIDEYYIAFSKCIKAREDVTPFLELSLKGTIDSLTEMKKRIGFFIRELALRDYIHFLSGTKTITKRQNSLVILLLDSPATLFSLNDLLEKVPYSLLYRRVSSQTARRDIKKLLELNLIRANEKGLYLLNIYGFDSKSINAFTS
jgi:Fic family protein